MDIIIVFVERLCLQCLHLQVENKSGEEISTQLDPLNKTRPCYWA
jgi:hypothetical protein